MSIKVHLEKSEKYFMVYKEELRQLFQSSYFLLLALTNHLNENLHLLFHFPSAPASSHLEISLMSTSACNFICHWQHKNCPSNTSVFQSQNLCECVTSHDRRDLKCDWVKGLEVRRWAWVYLRRPSLTTKVLKREGRDKRERERT